MEQSSAVESAEPADNDKIGEVELRGLRPGLPTGSPIDVTFQLPEPGRLIVRVTGPESGRAVQASLELEVPGRAAIREVPQSRWT